MAAAVFGLGAVAHGEVEVPSGAKRYFAFGLDSVRVYLVFGFVQEETAPVGVCVVGHFFVQHVVQRRSHIDVLFIPLAVLAVLEQAFKVVQVLFQVGFLLSLDVFFLGIVQNDVQTVRGAETFLVDGATACATCVGSRLVESPNITTSHFVAANIGFFELANIYAVFVTFDFFEKHIDTAIDPVDVQVEMLAARAVMACLPKEPVCKCVTYQALVNIRTVENPVVGRRQPEQAYILAFTLFVTDFHAVPRLGEQSRGLSTDFDTNIVTGSFGTISHIVCLSVQYFHCGRNFFCDFAV